MMMPPAIAKQSFRLYPQLLGASWDLLDEAVRHMHGDGEVVIAAGVFQVRRASNRLVRWLGSLAGLPVAGSAVEVRLTVIPQGRGENWLRTFAGRPLASYQCSGPDGLLAERMGLAEMHFRLQVVESALRYHPQGMALCLGPVRLTLPRWLAARVSAVERAVEEPGRTHVAVEVTHPMLGLLVAYDGTIKRIEAGE
jgi:Domain of unknown function (DUF4166)